MAGRAHGSTVATRCDWAEQVQRFLDPAVAHGRTSIEHAGGPRQTSLGRAQLVRDPTATTCLR
ncbi:hypothetical protein K7957_05715 [Sphingomonas yunnanensis]|uniref:hypothetical protein n=1 Tax=Sphingomonas yunnanensis TaxID=310400 RepID=UPI001CA65B97|nr:hypothetical protein [Sphingomonas yunnanensis]MBY9062427.1 hypothetical protein [Sphingomonas yunnanensis]